MEKVIVNVPPIKLSPTPQSHALLQKCPAPTTTPMSLEPDSEEWEKIRHETSMCLNALERALAPVVEEQEYQEASEPKSSATKAVRDGQGSKCNKIPSGFSSTDKPKPALYRLHRRLRSH